MKKTTTAFVQTRLYGLNCLPPSSGTLCICSVCVIFRNRTTRDKTTPLSRTTMHTLIKPTALSAHEDTLLEFPLDIELWWSSPSWCSVTLLNSRKGSTTSAPGVAMPLSRGTPGIALDPLMSTLSLSLTFRKFNVSMPRPALGTMGGFMWRIRAHCVVRKKGCALMSDAPARAPSLRFSSLMRSFRIRDLQRLGTN